MKTTRSILGWPLLLTLLLQASLASAQGQKGGGGGTTTTYSYTLTDLLGFPSNGYQSRPSFITNRDLPIPAEDYPGGNVMIYGVSRIHVTVDEITRTEFHPALWRVDSDGSFPASDPLDSGLPGLAREVVTNGLNSLGIGVVDTQWGGEQDAQGNWIAPAHVDDPILGYHELAGLNGDRNTDVSGINDDGQIVGSSDDGGLLWQLNGDGTTGIPTSLGFFTPADINNYGVMAGIYQGYMTIAWFEGTTLQMQSLTTTARSFGANVEAINDCAIDDPRLAIVGTSWRNEANQYGQSNSVRGVIWRPNSLLNKTSVLGTLGGATSTALDVNLSGQVVGVSDTKRAGQHAFVYSNGVMSDLNTKVALNSQTLNFATGINNSGDIIGFMQYPKPISEQRGFLLRPITTP